MPKSIDILAATFTAMATAKTMAGDAQDSAKSSGWQGACAVGEFFAGEPLPGKYVETIEKAYKIGTNKDIPKATLSDMKVFAKAGADGTLPMIRAGWDDWSAFCKANDQTAGTAYNICRDLLRHNAKDDVHDVFTLDATGIGEYLGWKDSAHRSMKKLHDALVDLGAEINAHPMTQQVFNFGEALEAMRASDPASFATKKKGGKKTRVVPAGSNVVALPTHAPVVAPAAQPQAKGAPFAVTADDLKNLSKKQLAALLLAK